MLLTDARLVTPAGIVESGWLEIVDDRIRGTGEGSGHAAGADAVALDGRLVLPGFVDLHVHGGGGASMQTSDLDALTAAVDAHRANGTTSTLVSLVSAPVEDTVSVLRGVAQLARSGEVLGAHLEGPFLNPRRGGAHDAAHLLAPDIRVLERLLEAGDGTVRVVTLAPELDGSDALIDRLVAAGVVVALGHSDADAPTADDAFDRGATLVTHLFNGMRPWHHRDPGLAGAGLAHPTAVVELIADGVHVDDVAARVAVAAAGDRVALVTDAMAAAAGGAPGSHPIGARAAEVRDGAPRLADGTLAGSLLTMADAVRHSVRDLGLSIEAATRAASTTPAHVLGLGDLIGAIAPGCRADLVVFDDDLGVEAVMRAGVWITSGRLFHT